MRYCEYVSEDGICGGSILDFMWNGSKFCQEHRKKRVVPRKPTFMTGNLNISKQVQQQHRAKIIAEVLKTPKIIGYQQTMYLLLDCFKVLISRGEDDFIFEEYHAEDRQEFFKLDLIEDDN